MLNFAQAIALLSQGKKIGSATLFTAGDYVGMDGDEVAVFDENGDVVENLTLTTEVLGTTDFYEITVEANPEIWGYLNVEKGRWMSTNNPDGLRAKGIEVKLFVLAEG